MSLNGNAGNIAKLHENLRLQKILHSYATSLVDLRNKAVGREKEDIRLKIDTIIDCIKLIDD